MDNQGTTPSGLCGACILIAAKLHKINIDINNISKVIHVCHQTILNRIDEFSLTRVASMTMEEFEAFEKSNFYPGAEPPSILKALKEKNQIEEKRIEGNGKRVENNENKLENCQIDNGKVNNNKLFSFGQSNSGLNINNNELISLRDNNSGLNNKNNKCDNENFILRQINSGLKNFSFNNKSFNLRAGNSGLSINDELLTFNPKDSGFSKSDNNNVNLSIRPGYSDINRSNRIKELKETSTDDEQLSNIPDNEEYKYIYNKDEYEVRKQFWEIKFNEWIEQQKEKEEKEGKEKKIKVSEPKRGVKKMEYKSDGSKITSDEAVKNNNKILGKNVDFNYIKRMLSKTK